MKYSVEWDPQDGGRRFRVTVDEADLDTYIRSTQERTGWALSDLEPAVEEVVPE